MPKQLTHRTAFTLIELLVVISIIALLVGILLPALGAARDTARSSKCLSNNKQIALGLMNYSNDYDGQMPAMQIYSSATFWWTTLAEGEYCGSLRENETVVYACPETEFNDAWAGAPTSQTDERHFDYLTANGTGTGGLNVPFFTSYMANAQWPGGSWWSGGSEDYNNIRPFYVYDAAAGPPARLSPSKIDFYVQPSKTFLTGDGYYMCAQPQFFGLRHANQTTANYNFADGHAATFQQEQLPPETAGGGLFYSFNFMDQTNAGFTEDQYSIRLTTRSTGW